jgi:hypothetical protein
MGHRAGLDGCEKSRFYRDSIPGLSSMLRVAIPTELSRPTNLPKEGLKPKTKCILRNFY